MNIKIFTGSKDIENAFSEIKKLKEYHLTFLQPGELKMEIRNGQSGSLYLIDICGFDVSDRVKILKILRQMKNHYYGIIDPHGVIDDVAELFHNGVCEYLGKDLVNTIIPNKRIQKILKYLKERPHLIHENGTEKSFGQNYIPTGNDWNNILPGKEYTFCFMFIEIDGQKEFKSHFGKEHIGEITASFRNYITNQVARINGKLWIWMDFGGLILIPFDGKKIDSIIFSFELMINRLLISIEYNFDRIISYRIALHLGNSEYKPRGETGKIVSESINSIFHLGQKHSKPGTFVLTENLFEFIPKGLEDCFIDDGVFEGRRIKKMVKIKD